jgi:hypothetical protein
MALAFGVCISEIIDPILEAGMFAAFDYIERLNRSAGGHDGWIVAILGPEQDPDGPLAHGVPPKAVRRYTTSIGIAKGNG